MLFTLQRYEFFSKSQPHSHSSYHQPRCCLPYKGTNFSANHNFASCTPLVGVDVVYPTKVRIFQQITTQPDGKQNEWPMLFTLQRYEFFSKSQLFRYKKKVAFRCCLPYKGTNFSANHNVGYKFMSREADVVYPTKVRIFQQITT